MAFSRLRTAFAHTHDADDEEIKPECYKTGWNDDSE
jgi:hypothetical protein